MHQCKILGPKHGAEGRRFVSIQLKSYESQGTATPNFNIDSG